MGHGECICPSNRVVHSNTGWAAAVQQLPLTSVLKPPHPLHACPAPSHTQHSHSLD
jgi:hypothetical protein